VREYDHSRHDEPIKPCPNPYCESDGLFCIGGKPEYDDGCYRGGFHDRDYWIKCTRCGMEGPKVSNLHHGRWAPGISKQIWNDLPRK
jgi:hypothetical protein